MASGREQELELAEIVFQNTQDAMFLIEVSEGDQFYVQRVNEIYENLTGLANDEIVGKPPREVVDDEIGAEIESQYHECVERRETIQYQEEIPVGGEPKQWETKLTPIIQDGAVVKLVGAMRDITEQQLRKQKIAKTNRKLQTVMESVDTAIFIKDTEGQYQLMNHRCRELLGVGPDEDIAGLTDYDLFDEGVAEANREDDRRVVESGETINIEEEIPTSEGKRIFLTSKSPMTDQEGEISGICAVSTDITYRKEQERLRRQNERLGEFANVISHDLRNPLNVATGRLELAKDECDSEHLVKVSEAHNRIETLINDLLTLAREGVNASDMAPVELAVASQRSWETVETGSASLEITSNKTIKADVSRLRQLFENLMRNAIEHGGDGVQVTIGDLDDCAGFYVADDGPGIPADEREQVFENGYSTQTDGTGFGLAIVTAIVQNHGWDITVTASEDGGARFEIFNVESV